LVEDVMKLVSEQFRDTVPYPGYGFAIDSDGFTTVVLVAGDFS
jgi:hypothetical protein